MAPIQTRAFSLVSAILILLPAVAYATNYVVGDGAGWTTGFDYSTWANGKKFRIGDTLTFNYPQGNHNVIKVDGTGFANCATSPNSGILTSGSDKVTFTATGNKWYICGFAGHCDSGQKLKITVLPKMMMGWMPAPSPEPMVSGFPWMPVPVATPGYMSGDTELLAPPSLIIVPTMPPEPWVPWIPSDPKAPAPSRQWFWPDMPLAPVPAEGPWSS